VASFWNNTGAGMVIVDGWGIFLDKTLALGQTVLR
jgi:hypothetical protein